MSISTRHFSITTAPDARLAAAPGFLAGGGEMGARVRAHDWGASPLGAPETWPPPLRTLTSVMFAANQAMFVAWGPARTMIYNDAYAAILGDRHPGALGRRFEDVWFELEESVWPILDQAYAGIPASMHDIRLVIRRGGREEEAHFAFFYTPVRDIASGEVLGVYCACSDTTARVLSDQRERITAALDQRTRALRDCREVMATSAEVLATELGAAQAGYVELDSDGEGCGVEQDWSDGRIATHNRALARAVADRTWSSVARARAETSLRAREALLAAVLDALPVGVVITDARGRVLRDNAANARSGERNATTAPRSTAWRGTSRARARGSRRTSGRWHARSVAARWSATSSTSPTSSRPRRRSQRRGSATAWWPPP